MADVDSGRLRVIVVAGYVSVVAGGEAILPWHYFTHLRALGIDAHLVTQSRQRCELIERAPELVPFMHFTDDARISRALKFLGRRLPISLQAVTIWPLAELLAGFNLRKRCVQLVKQSPGPAIVHQPMPVSPRTPSTITRVGAPVVIGPMNGGMAYPPGFLGDVRRAERLARVVGRLVGNYSNLILSGKRDAALLLVANRRTHDALPRVARRARVEYLVENGVDLEVFTPREPLDAATRRFVFVGRLVDWKRVDLLLEALALTPEGYLLEICGFGDLEDSLKEKAAELGLSSRVTFHGLLSQAECAKVLARSDALVLSSTFECGGAVVLEAMAIGVPVIATDWGGPGEYLDSTVGVLVAPTDPRSVVRNFAAAMTGLSENPGRIRALGSAGRDRIEERYSWDAKIAAILKLYDSCLAAYPQQPVPAQPVA